MNWVHVEWSEVDALKKRLRELCDACIMAPQNRNAEQLTPCCTECSLKWEAAQAMLTLQQYAESQEDAADVASNLNTVASAKVQRLEAELARLRAVVEPLDRLREDEGSGVLFACPNPDFTNELPNEAVEIIADWTNWRAWRFTGDTLSECLATAERAKAAVTRKSAARRKKKVKQNG